MAATHDPRYIEIISRLRRARQAREIGQASLAKSLGKTQSYVSKVETCERRLDLIEALDWCLVLGIRLEDVLPPKLVAALAPRPGTKVRRKRP